MRRLWAAVLGLALCTCAHAGPRTVSHAVVRAVEADTLLDLAREHGLGYGEIVAANPGVDPWLPGDGAAVVLPVVHLLPRAPAEGIVVNLAEMRLYLFDGAGAARSYPIGIGRPGWRTPLGLTEVVRLREAPTWYPPDSARREDPTLSASVPPGPDNPLGSHALYLSWERYLIHGTNEPWGVGRRVSRGCIRLYPEDIVELYDRVRVGTPVRVIYDRVKIGWIDRELYLEVHPPALEEGESPPRAARPVDPEQLSAELRETAGSSAQRLDWDAVRAALGDPRGVPVLVTRPLARPGLGERLRLLAESLLGPSGS